MTSLLAAEGVRVDDRLESTDLRCSGGEMLALIGPNGAGKTTLLRSLGGIELDEGTVLIDGEDVLAASPARRLRLLSYLPATRALIWPISARDVIGLGLRVPDMRRIDELLHLFELTGLAGRPVNSLSTGERSRVLLARALAARPRLLLLDEPLSNLDPYWVLRTLEILRDTAIAEECAIIASLHDLAQLGAFDRVLLIEGGRIVADAEPSTILESSSLAEAFRIERHGEAWRVSSREGPRSSQ
jgi:iron complex transport system ATP-binding protein